MKAKLFFFIICGSLFVSSDTYSQTIFQKTIGGNQNDYAYSVAQTIDGGYIISGYTKVTNPVEDIYLVKTNSLGDTLWTKIYDGTGIERAYCGIQTSDGGYVLTGQGSFGTSNIDAFLLKTDSIGNISWIKSYGGTLGDVGKYVQQTSDGGYIIVGNTITNPGSISHILLIRTNGVGDTLWTKIIAGTSNDWGATVQEIVDGFIIGGTTWSYGAGISDVFLLKTDASGNLQWAKTFGGIDNEFGSSARQTADGGFVVCGVATFPSPGDGAYLIKTDNSGNLLWSKTFHGSFGTNLGSFASIQQMPDGGYIIAGSIGAAPGQNIYMVRTDSNGDTLWTKHIGTLGADDLALCIQLCADGGFMTCGYTGSFGAGQYDIYLIKSDSSGNMGCYQNTPQTVQYTPPTQISSPVPYISSGLSVWTPVIITSSGGTMFTQCLITETEENEVTNLSMNIYPNPTTGTFTVRTKSGANEISVFNSLGEAVFQRENFASGNVVIDLSSKPKGIYFVKVMEGEKIAVGKIVVM